MTTMTNYCPVCEADAGEHERCPEHRQEWFDRHIQSLDDGTYVIAEFKDGRWHSGRWFGTLEYVASTTARYATRESAESALQQMGFNQ